MSEFLKKVLSKNIVTCGNIEESNRSRRSSRRSDLDSSKLFPQSPKAVTKQVPKDSLNIQYPILLLMMFFEPTFYFAEYMISSDDLRLVPTIAGYSTFLYLFAIYIFIRNQSDFVKKNEKLLLYIAIIGTVMTSLLNICPLKPESLTLFSLFPLLMLKVVYIIYTSLPFALVLPLIVVVMACSIVSHILHEQDVGVIDYLQSFGYILYSIIVLFLISRKPVPAHKEEEEQIIEQEDFFRASGICKAFDHLEEGVVIAESGSLVYSNQGCKKLFKESSKGMISSRESLDERATSFFVNQFTRVKNVKAINASLDKQIKEIIRGESYISPKDSMSKIGSRHMDSPDFLLVHQERETSLLNLFTQFIQNEPAFKKHHIGFDPSNQLPLFEAFKGVLDDNNLTINIGYFESARKSYLCLILQHNPYLRENEELTHTLDAQKKIPQYVAHEMRNPLGAAQALLEAAQDDSQIAVTTNSKYVTPSLRMIQYSLALVNDLLDAGQIAAGKFKIALEVANLSNIVNNVLSMFEMKAQVKKIKLSVSVDKRLPKEISTDPARLSQILINLVSNALKYTHKNGSITLKAEYNVLNNRIITFSVEDTGLGIRPEDQKELLNDWKKVEGGANSKLNPHGIGLGLSISDKLARQLGQEGGQEGLKIESVFGKGTKIKFSIEHKKIELSTRNASKALTFVSARKIDSSENYTSSLEENQASLDIGGKIKAYPEVGSRRFQKATTLFRESSFKKQKTDPCACAKALIIDDDVFSGDSLSMILKSFKIEADVVQSTEEGLERIKAKQAISNCTQDCKAYKVIFMDAMMEGMDGFESTVFLTEKMAKAEIEEMPIVFCTGLDDGEEERARNAGAGFFITKPISKSKLSKILRKLGFELEGKSP